MERPKDMFVDRSSVRDTSELEEWRRSLLVSAAEAGKDLARRRRTHRAIVSVALVATMVAITSVTIGLARRPDLLAILGLAVRDIARIALGSVWFFGGLLTWLATRR